jgi:NADH-quinone oxidoreductase subunit E
MAPVMQVGDDYHGDLDIARIDTLLDRLRTEAATVADLAAAASPGE